MDGLHRISARIKFPALLMSLIVIIALMIGAFPFNLPDQARASSFTPVFGTLQSDPAHASEIYSKGVRLAHVALSWRQYEPTEGSFSSTYISSVQQKLTTFRQNNLSIVLDLGVQYPPDWIFTYPNSRYIDQYGDAYIPNETGKNVANTVFNQTLRDKQAAYVQRVFSDLGSNFYAVRLGGGWYGELNYPSNSYNSHTNCYWAFDNIAQGKATGLPAGMSVDPVIGWIPGAPSTNHASASSFANWYMDSLKNYHDWQIRTVRAYYSGKLAMLYPSWGVRPGQLSAAINVDLNGSTSAEVNGEVQRGFDFARYVAGITDPNVIVYTTWIDANYGNDASTNPADWTPAHYLSSLASTNPLHLSVWGENTGRNSYTDMQRSFQKMSAYGLIGLMWAFEPDLYTTTYATLDQYAGLISQYAPTSTSTPPPTSTPTATSTLPPTSTSTPTSTLPPAPTFTSTLPPTSTPTATPAPGDTIPPVVSISQPVNGSTVNGTITIAAQATDNVAVKSVQIVIDNVQKSVCSTGSCSYRWNTKKVTPGSHTIQAIAQDNTGNISSPAQLVVYK